jgi:hypothetical protein
LEPAAVRGRDALIDDLIDRVTSRRVSALVGPRRYGKTSVLRRLAADLPELSLVWADLYEVTSTADLVLRLDQALASAPGPFAANARTVAASLQVSLGVARVEFSRPARQQPHPAAKLSALLDVLVRTARSTPTLLVIDEFSSIAAVRGGAGALCTALQHHYTELGIVFAGSKPSMMRKLFGDRVEPFYAQADLVDIAPLDAVAVTALVADGFAGTNRDAGILPGPLLAFTGGHPHRTMQLADATWQRTAPGETVDEHRWGQALAVVRTDSAEGMERLFSHFEASQRDVLRIVASNGSLYGASARALELASSSAANAKARLLADGDLVEGPDGPVVADPLLGDWLRTTLPL